MKVFKIHNVFVIGEETDHTYTLPVRGATPRTGRNLEMMNLSGCYVFKTRAAAVKALKALAG